MKYFLHDGVVHSTIFLHILVTLWRLFVSYCSCLFKHKNKGEISSLSTDTSETASDGLTAEFEAEKQHRGNAVPV